MVAFGTQSMAQVKVQSVEAPSITRTAVMTPSAKKATPTQKDDAIVYFTEDFSNGLAGQDGNGAWTTGEDQGSLWFQTFPVGEPNGYSKDEAVLGGTHPDYGTQLPLFFSTGDVVNSPTRLNGVMMLDIDRWNSLSTVETPLTYDPENESASRNDNQASATLISPSIDLTGVDNALLNFYQRIRLCCGPSYSADVELSVDGGNTWIPYDAFNDYGGGNDNIDIQVSIDISDVLQDATDLSNVYVRFNWNGIEQSTYYWTVDDVNIVSMPSNDLIAGKSYTNNWVLQENTVFEDDETIATPASEYYGSFEYFDQPEYYTRPYNFGLEVTNGGTDTQTGVQLKVVGTKPAGGTFEWYSEGIELESGAATTLWINDAELTDMGALEMGEYSFTFEAIQLEEESRPEDNTGKTRKSRVSNEADNNGFAIMRNDANNYSGAYTTRGQDIIWNTTYVFPELESGSEPKYITHVEAVFLSSPGFAASVPGEVVYFNVRKGHPFEGETEALYGSDQLLYEDENLGYTITPEDLWVSGSGSFKWASKELPTPLLIEPGVVYQAEMRVPAAGSPIAFMPVTGPQEDISSLLYDYADGSWFFLGTNAMPLRFRTGNTVGVDKITVESGLTLVQNYPNPFTDMTKIQYMVEKSAKVNLEVRDITGKLVFTKDLGNVPANAPQTVEFQRGNLAPGVYTYTIATSEFQVSRKLTVQ